MSEETKNIQTEVIEETSSLENDSSFSNFNYNSFIEALTKEIPDTTKIDIPKEKSAENKIDSFNKNAENAIVDAYKKSENLRLKRQKPIMIAIMVMLIVQLCAFNTLIFILLYKSFTIISIESNLFTELLDFLKYYVGAVIVELIGLMLVITKNTFSLHLGKTIDKIISSRKPK